MQDTQKPDRYVTDSEFTQFERSVDGRFDDLSRTMSNGFASINSAIEKIRDNSSRGTNWSAIIGGVAILGSFIALYVNPLKAETQNQEKRIWTLETSYVPEATVLENLKVLAGRNNEIRQQVNSDAKLTAERWGRTDTERSSMRTEMAIVREWQIKHDATVAPLNASQWVEIRDNTEEINRTRDWYESASKYMLDIEGISDHMEDITARLRAVEASSKCEGRE